MKTNPTCPKNSFTRYHQREELKKKLLSKSKKKKQNKKIWGKKSPDGKTRRKMKGVPVREGDCIIPFTYEGERRPSVSPLN